MRHNPWLKSDQNSERSSVFYLFFFKILTATGSHVREKEKEVQGPLPH